MASSTSPPDAPGGGSWRFTDGLLRTVIEFLVCVIITLVVARTWLLEPRVVPSASMVPALCGPHRDYTCGHCGFEFRCDASLAEGNLTAYCPNCWAVVPQENSLPVAHGDRLLVFQQAFRVSEPHRWDVAVFRRPAQAHLAYVKRIVGLPGETISLQHGDVYVDGRLERKPLSKQRALSVLVYHGDHPAPDLPRRWRADGQTTSWVSSQGTFRWSPPAKQHHPIQSVSGEPTEELSGVSRLDWLIYHHEIRHAHQGGQAAPEPITDRQLFNQLKEVRTVDELHVVSDLLWSVKLRTQALPPGDSTSKEPARQDRTLGDLDTAERPRQAPPEPATALQKPDDGVAQPEVLWFRAEDGREQFLLQIDIRQGSASVYHQGALVHTVAELPQHLQQALPNAPAARRRQVHDSGQPMAPSEKAETSETLHWELSTVDRQFLVAINGQLLFPPVPFQFSQPPPAGTTEPFSFAAEGLCVELSDLKLSRDIYYTSPPHTVGPSTPAGSPSSTHLPQAAGVAAGGPASTSLLAPSVVEYRLGPDEYFMLGDNTTYSEDSRYWQEGPGVPRRLLIGKPLAVHLPSHWTQFGGRWLQVPDWERIRYIR